MHVTWARFEVWCDVHNKTRSRTSFSLALQASSFAYVLYTALTALQTWFFHYHAAMGCIAWVHGKHESYLIIIHANCIVVRTCISGTITPGAFPTVVPGCLSCSCPPLWQACFLLEVRNFKEMCHRTWHGFTGLSGWNSAAYRMWLVCSYTLAICVWEGMDS